MYAWCNVWRNWLTDWLTKWMYVRAKQTNHTFISIFSFSNLIKIFRNRDLLIAVLHLCTSTTNCRHELLHAGVHGLGEKCSQSQQSQNVRRQLLCYLQLPFLWQIQITWECYIFLACVASKWQSLNHSESVQSSGLGGRGEVLLAFHRQRPTEPEVTLLPENRTCFILSERKMLRKVASCKIM